MGRRGVWAPVGARHSRQAEVGGRRGKPTGLQFEPVMQYDGLAERQPWFRAVPGHEIVDGEFIRAFRGRRTERIQHRAFRVVQVRRRKTRLGAFFFLFDFFIPRPPRRRTILPEAASGRGWTPGKAAGDRGRRVHYGVQRRARGSAWEIGYAVFGEGSLGC
jgi:hypothetical protein